MRGIHNSQIIHLYLTPSQCNLIEATNEKKIENILDPILYMANVQAKQQALDAVVTIKQKFRKHVVQECERILDEASFEELKDPQLRDLNEILIVKLPTTFSALYSTIEELLDDRLALEAFRNML